MQPIFDVCQPRPEVLSGALKEDIFAARLHDVMTGSAPPIYQDAELFFDNTYPTEGLRLLLREALGRLTGQQPTASPIIRLETAFGGGKTHNLIALYHAARGTAPPECLADVLSATLLPQPGDVRIAGVVGSDLDPSVGLYHADDNIRTFTLWGELAYQLGGTAGYALARESDHNRSAPGTGLFEELVGRRPTLIMLDELARHMRAAQTTPTATGKSDLAEQTVAFLMSLLEFAASRAQVVVVLTLAGIDDAFSKETAHLREQLAEAHKVSARQERVITPTGETEIAAIVRHRLFQRLDEQAATAAARAYADAYRAWHEQDVLLPHRALAAEYAQEIAAAYPFHPELLNALTLRVATIPNFQKTRGALRLLALVVRALWRERSPDTWLIHPHHVDLGASNIVEELTSRLDRPAFKQVIEADIVSPKESAPAHASRIDQAWVAAGKPRYARRAATTVFLHSLSQGTVSGIDPADLRLAALAPGDDALFIHKAAEQLAAKGWFFEWDGHRYRFKPEPSINKIIADERSMVGRIKAKQELDARIRKVWKSGALKAVYFPQEASDVDDDAGLPKLAILHFDAAAATAANPAPPELAQKLARRAGSLDGYRRFPNNILFLVADAERVDGLVETAQRYLAIARITGDAQRMGEFTREQQKQLKKLGEAAELDARVAITKTYRHLYFPSADAPKRDAQLFHELLPAQDQGDVQKDQSAVVLRALRQQKKALTGNEPVQAAAYIKSRAWDTHQVTMTTEDLRKAFARRLGLPLLFDLNQLKKTILNGVKTQVWVYYDARAGVGYDHESPPPAVQVSEEAHLYLPEEAARLDLPIKGKMKPEALPPQPTCPVCGNPADRCTCGESSDWTPPVVRPPLRGEGVPQQAFQQLLDVCHDQEAARLAELRIVLHGEGQAGAQDMRTLGLIIPQLGKGEFRVDQVYNAEFSDGQYISNRIELTWNYYRQLKQATDALAQDAAKFTATTTLTITFPKGLEVSGDRFRTVHEVLTSVGLGPIRLEAEAADEDAAAADAA